MMQRVLMLVLFVYSVLVCADDTVLKLYRPFGEALEQVSPGIKNTLPGQCVSQSQLIVREDAWRCQAEGRVYDPCFVKEAGKRTEALCPQSPWVGDSVQILVNSPLNNDQHSRLDMSTAFPWAIELANGEHCQAAASDEVYEGMPVRYRCSKQNKLIGHIQRCKAAWSMLEKTSTGVETVIFSKAWF
ncbi:MAG: hypothetical protein ACHP65_02205 [Legionellales bacterium]